MFQNRSKPPVPSVTAPTTTVLHVPDMHCNACVARIDVALKVLNLTYAVSLEDKTVSVRGGKKELGAAKKALDDLGFLVSE